MKLQAAAIVGVCFTYAWLRYVVLGGVSPVHTPTFLTNKVISAASVVFLLRAAFGHMRGDQEQTRRWGMMALNSAGLHVLLSLSILSKAYYPGLFSGERMNLTGELAIGAGALAACLFWLIGRSQKVELKKEVLQALSSLVVGGHLLALGSAGWLQVSSWPGGMPPISLLSFLFAATATILFLRGQPDQADHSEDQSTTTGL